MADFRKISIDNKPSLNTDICVVDRSTNSLVFLSCIGYITNIKEASKALNYNNNVYINGYGTYKTMHKGFNTEIKRTADNDFSHLVAYLKDKEFNDSDGDERIICYLFARNNEDKYNMLFDKLYQHLSVPLLKDWMEIIFNKMYENDYITTLNVLHIYDDAPFYAYKINIKRQQLLDIITTLLKTGEISIRDTNLVSETMCNIDGLDTYLNSFGDILAQKIQQNFVPKFIPGEQEYSETVNDYDDSCYEAGLELFDAQKSVIQACVNNFKKSDITFIIGECGSGSKLCK